MSKRKRDEDELDKIIKKEKIIPKELSYDLKYKIYERICKIKILRKKVELIEHQKYLDDNNLIKCELCGRIWDGYAQCFPCD
tara:strand:- start:3809 stop:4054 length:246 start_codon:yes stop_codon:yes gene_type:complete